MKDEYVIINKKAIQKRIEEIEELLKKQQVDFSYQVELDVLKEILSQSTPLFPEIEKAFDAGNAYCVGSHQIFEQTHSNKENYISNLKIEL